MVWSGFLVIVTDRTWADARFSVRPGRAVFIWTLSLEKGANYLHFKVLKGLSAACQWVAAVVDGCEPSVHCYQWSWRTISVTHIYFLVVVVCLVCKCHRRSEDWIEAMCAQPSDRPLLILSTAPISAGCLSLPWTMSFWLFKVTLAVCFNQCSRSATKELM